MRVSEREIKAKFWNIKDFIEIDVILEHSFHNTDNICTKGSLWSSQEIGVNHRE